MRKITLFYCVCSLLILSLVAVVLTVGNRLANAPAEKGIVMMVHSESSKNFYGPNLTFTDNKLIPETPLSKILAESLLKDDIIRLEEETIWKYIGREEFIEEIEREKLLAWQHSTFVEDRFPEHPIFLPEVRARKEPPPPPTIMLASSGGWSKKRISRVAWDNYPLNK